MVSDSYGTMTHPDAAKKGHNDGGPVDVDTKRKYDANKNLQRSKVVTVPGRPLKGGVR